MALEPLTANDPVIKTLPVNWWVFESKLPFTEEPVIYSCEAVIVWIINVWAVIVPVDTKLPLWFIEPVIVWVPINTLEPVVAKLLVLAFKDDV